MPITILVPQRTIHNTSVRFYKSTAAIQLYRHVLLHRLVGPTIDVLKQDFWTKLKKHLLPRIKVALASETQSRPDLSSSTVRETESLQPDSAAELNGIHFKSDRMYRHNIMRINYTTYDVRRAQDTINPNTDHKDIVLLSASAAQDDGSPNHQYVYARVLGIYHVNVIYTGPGLLDYRARRMEFLWVRWFANMNNEPVQSGWVRRQMDKLKFPPMQDVDSFGFVDPANVLRGAHLIPNFVVGLRHTDTVGISECARDSKDWKQYCVGRLVITNSSIASVNCISLLLALLTEIWLCGTIGV
jgi:hypothetical protein